MKYSVIPTPHFKRQAKKLLKRYISLKQELAELERSLQLHPTQGVSLGNNIYKLRLAIKSKGKGKSGGARIITYTVLEEKEVYLMSIYDKSEISTIDDKSLKMLVYEIKSGRDN